MKKLFPLLAVVLVVTGIIFLKKNVFAPKPIEMPKYGNYLSCVGFPFDLKVKFKSSVVLLKSAIPEDKETRQRLFFAAIYYQNMYTFTNLHDYNQNTNLKWTSLTDKDPTIKITKMEDTPYNLDVQFPNDLEISTFPPAAGKYITNLMSTGKIAKSDPALRVYYEYENDLFMCFNENKMDVSQLKVVQPIDPYTAYFVVPEKERKFFSNTERNAEKVINPCLDPSAVTPNNFTQMYLWFYWRPFAEGHDSNQSPFNCRDYYKEGISIQKVEPEFFENKPKETAHLAFDRLASLDRPIKFAFFMGTAESKAFVKFEKEEAENYIKRYLSGIDSVTAKNELPFHQKKFDLKFSSLLWFMRNVTEQMDVKQSEYSVNDHQVKVILKGKFKLSHKDAIITIYLNQTNARYEGVDSFVQNFANEFLANDVVIYGGHASVEGAFARSFKDYQEQMKANQIPSLNYQIFAILSCTSNFMFKPSSFPKVQTDGFERDYIQTGGGFSDTSGNSALILIGQIDSCLYNKKYVPFGFWAKMAKSDNFYILSNH